MLAENLLHYFQSSLYSRDFTYMNGGILELVYNTADQCSVFMMSSPFSDRIAILVQTCSPLG